MADEVLGAYWGEDGLLHLAPGRTSTFLCGLPNTGGGPVTGVVAAAGCPTCYEDVP